MTCLLIVFGLVGQVDASLRVSVMTINELANPVLRSEEEIDDHAAVCRRLLALPQPQGDPSLSSPDLLLKQSLARLFMTFARPGRGGAGVEPGHLQLVDLQTHDDPALQLLRERVRLPAPRGYVCFGLVIVLVIETRTQEKPSTSTAALSTSTMESADLSR